MAIANRAVLQVVSVFLIFLATTGFGQAPSQINEKDHARQHEAENLMVFQQWIRWNNGGSLLANHLIAQANELYAKRDSQIARLKTRDDWTARQRLVRNKLESLLGAFPDRAPLEAQVTGTIRSKGYRIEKLIYQSHPGYFVTGCLYVPDKIRGKAPAVLNLIGHEQESFRATLDQVMATNLAKKGIVVLTIDPPGQGEHQQYFDPSINFSSIGYSVVEHCYFGNQCFLTGVSSAKYFIWDAIRAIDYLVSRKDVDRDRIGVTGFSGGGTITSYVSALDERVKVAIPSSWSTSNRRQLETKGAQDAEANLINGLSEGITFEDLIELRAPKPTMLTFTTRDEYLTVQGAREAHNEIRKAYDAFSAAENLRYVEDDSKHWLTPKIRKSIFGFFIKHFGLSASDEEEDVDIYSQEQLKVTSAGQIGTEKSGRMIFDINKHAFDENYMALVASRANTDTHIRKVAPLAARIAGYKAPSGVSPTFINGQYHRPGYTVSKLAIMGEGNYPIPFLLFVPDNLEGSRAAVIYLHPDGKQIEALAGAEIETLVRKGYVVAAPDVIGVGETRNTATTQLAVCYTGVLIGRSIIGIQTGDIVRITQYLRSRPDVDSSRIAAYAKGQMCIPLMHAAAFDSGISEIALVDPLISYRSVAASRLYRIGLVKREGGGTHHPYDIDFSWGVAGALTAYDLPDLIGSMAPRRVLLSGLRDQNLAIADDATLREDMKFPLAAYKSRDAVDRLEIDAGSTLKVVEWLFEGSR